MKMDRYTMRGTIISVISLSGLLYELLLSESQESFLLVMYALIFSFGLYLILFMKDELE